MTDEITHTLAQRLGALCAAHGLQAENPGALLAAVSAKIPWPEHASEAFLLAQTQAVIAAEPSLVKAPPPATRPGSEEAMQAWLTARYPDWKSARAEVRTMLAERYKATLAPSASDRAVILRKSLEGRFGSVDKAPAVDRLALLHMENDKS